MFGFLDFGIFGFLDFAKFWSFGIQFSSVQLNSASFSLGYFA